jgi:uncharacterized protein YsxB (DUF464 family)
MTSIRFWCSADRFIGFKATGHTGYAPAGQDIVCAAVSTLVQTTVLGLHELVGLKLKIEQEPKTGLYSCLIVPTDDDVKLEQAHLLLNLMYLGLQQIAEEYRKYVQISLKEVQNDEF